ncbi:MAG: HIT family protein [Bacteroidota bacterium]|nr:HIT family protein [Bacteroidota bacterium]MDX5404471.1 HIT family protein [Bacteroidota bacterium]MDX5427889.1 HIT family protein [Bacteroidota bacterium]MDX5447762.1 HIT family protein [Bacteroidota bacterium]MDX5505756.1 HIT family protein [Bacteroidota bacterium]
MASIFSKIVSGDIPSYKVAENDHFLAFLDIFPLKKGHTLVIPKKEVDYLFDLDEKTYQDLWAFARKVAAGVEAAIPCKRMGVCVLGMEVPHAHIHLVPLDSEGDLNFRNPKKEFSEDEFKVIAESIRSKISID